MTIFAAALLLQGAVQAATPVARAAERPAHPRDLSGVWMNDDTLDERLKREGLKRLDPRAAPAELAGRPVEALLTPNYQAIRAARQAQRAAWETGAEPCQWPGMPRIMTYPYPFEILHTPGRITFLFEVDSQVRRIFLDRKEHLPFDELDPSFNGDSVGHWEGDTLVVDTVGFNTQTELARNLPHSDQLHIVERIRYVDADTIHDEITMTDPLAFTRPIVQTVVYSKRPDWRIREYSCLENNRDAPDAAGRRTQGVVAP